jgi:hypothetical protein
MDLDKKDGKILWEHTIEKEIKQLTDYQTFQVIDSGEAIPNDYSKIS